MNKCTQHNRRSMHVCKYERNYINKNTFQQFSIFTAQIIKKAKIDTLNESKIYIHEGNMQQ